MNALQLAYIFPDAKPVLEKLCRQDREKIKQYNGIKANVKAKLLTDVKAIASLDDILELVMLFHADIKQHIIKIDYRNDTRQVLDCEDRLRFNGQVLNFLSDKKTHPKADDWFKKVMTAKQYPIDNLLEFNRDGFAKCIWHNERTASLKYYPKTNSVHCFGCRKSEDAIGVVQELFNYSFKQAVQWLHSKN